MPKKDLEKDRWKDVEKAHGKMAMKLRAGDIHMYHASMDDSISFVMLLTRNLLVLVVMEKHWNILNNIWKYVSVL